MLQLKRHQLFEIRKTDYNLLAAAASSIMASEAPKIALQLRQFWPAIRQWEFGTPRTIDNLLRRMRYIKTENPKLRHGDTAYLWAARYYYYRRLNDWNVSAINKMALKIHIPGAVTTTNYHLSHGTEDFIEYVYFKHGEDWEDEDSITTLSTIRMYHEQRVAPSAMFSERVNYRYVSLLEDKEYELTNQHYQDCLEDFLRRVPVVEANANA